MEIHILRLPLYEPVRVGTIWASRDGAEFQYEESYLSSEAAVPLSLSLPLKKEPYSRSAMQSYFEGLLPEDRHGQIWRSRLASGRKTLLLFLPNAGGNASAT